MSTDNTKQQSTALLSAVTAFSATAGEKYVGEITTASSSLLEWLSYLRTSIAKNTCDRLLDSVQATVIETIGSLSLGLARPAIFSIRAQLELLLAWVYFNDHPVEWAYFEKTGEDFPMRAQVLSYFRKNRARFSDRLKLLEKTKARTIDDPYAVLSIHVHTISQYSPIKIGPLSSLVQSADRIDECVRLQFSVAEYLYDILTSWYADKWQDFPTAITNSVRHRLSKAQLKDFCQSD